MNFICKNCNAPIKTGEKFCAVCGTAVAQDEYQHAVANGEHTQTNQTVVKEPMPFGKAVKQGVKKLTTALKIMLKNPKKMFLLLLPTVIISAIWLVLSLLFSLGVSALPLQILSFFTFALGGMTGGAFGMMGGIFGKAMTAYFVNATIIPLCKKQKPFDKGKIKSGLQAVFAKGSLKGAVAISPVLIGFGLALIAYNFMNATACLQNSMIGIIGAVMALQLLSKGGGIIFSFLFMLLKVMTKGKAPSYLTIDRAIAGLAMGFTGAVALSLLPLSSICYILGVICLIGGIVAPLVENKTAKGGAIV